MDLLTEEKHKLILIYNFEIAISITLIFNKSILYSVFVMLKYAVNFSKIEREREYVCKLQQFFNYFYHYVEK